MEKIPNEDEPIIIPPEHSGGRWMLPIRDLRRSPTVNAGSMTPEEYDNFKAESDLLKEHKEQAEEQLYQNQVLKDKAVGKKTKPRKNRLKSLANPEKDETRKQ